MYNTHGHRCVRGAARCFSGRAEHRPRTRSPNGLALGAPGYLHPVGEAASLPSFATLNSTGGSVRSPDRACRLGGWRPRWALRLPVTPPLPSALCSLPVCVEQAQRWTRVAGLVQPLPWRSPCPGPPPPLPGLSTSPPPACACETGLTPVGESQRISGFHGKWLQ